MSISLFLTSQKQERCPPLGLSMKGALLRFSEHHQKVVSRHLDCSFELQREGTRLACDCLERANAPLKIHRSQLRVECPIASRCFRTRHAVWPVQAKMTACQQRTARATQQRFSY